jgi:hypothetical protein
VPLLLVVEADFVVVVVGSVVEVDIDKTMIIDFMLHLLL